MVPSSSTDFTEYTVTGSTFGPEGQVFYAKGDKLVEKDLLMKNPVINELAHICTLCNDARIGFDEVKAQLVFFPASDKQATWRSHFKNFYLILFSMSTFITLESRPRPPLQYSLRS